VLTLEISRTGETKPKINVLKDHGIASETGLPWRNDGRSIKYPHSASPNCQVLPTDGRGQTPLMRPNSGLNWLTSFLDWSVGVGRLFGIPVRLHITLLFLLIPVVSRQAIKPIYALEIAVGMVLSILLHELGHALTAKRYRLTDLLIMLHGFGGYALSSGARTPRQSLVISLMGPAVTFVLGGTLWAVARFGQPMVDPGTEAARQLWLVGYLGSLNLLLGVLNLIPSFPFDGGQALRAILAHRHPDFKAMRAVGHLGLVLSPLLFIYSLIVKDNFIGFFGLIGSIGSLQILMTSGGIRFGEVAEDRRAAKEMEAVKEREKARAAAYQDDVDKRRREREEQERLRKLLGE